MYYSNKADLISKRLIKTSKIVERQQKVKAGKTPSP
jgi:hypothetical protein